MMKKKVKSHWKLPVRGKLAVRGKSVSSGQLDQSDSSNSVRISVNLKTAACERCDLSLIWGKMRTAAQKTAPEIIWRCRLQEAGGRSEYT